MILHIIDPTANIHTAARLILRTNRYCPEQIPRDGIAFKNPHTRSKQICGVLPEVQLGTLAFAFLIGAIGAYNEANILQGENIAATSDAALKEPNQDEDSPKSRALVARWHITVQIEMMTFRPPKRQPALLKTLPIYSFGPLRTRASTLTGLLPLESLYGDEGTW